ncbi:MAG: type II toxin-antitoxin system Phd/YefM family antitoxin [Gaiella sp.]
MRTIPAGEFKTHCLSILDDVAETGETVVVTKRGKPVAQLTPLEPPKSLIGSVTYFVSDEELIAPIDVEWDAVKGRL